METAQQKAEGDAINFSVYTPRSVTRAGVPGVISNTNLKDNTTDVGKAGFGVLAYYTDDEKYDQESSKPDFMYNTQVKYNGSKWEYNPVMYWPNEYGATATSDNTDYVSFFAYAPYIDVTNETGIPVLEALADDAAYDAFAASLGIKYNEYTEKPVNDEASFAAYNGLTSFADGPAYIAAAVAQSGDATITTTGLADAWVATCGLKYYEATQKAVTTAAEYQAYLEVATLDEAKAALDELYKTQIQGKNITEISKNTAGGDPIVKYVVDTNPATSVDLLWGVAANTTDYTSIVSGYTPVTVGKPFVDLTKPKDPAADKLNWNLKHALAKLNVQIKYIADQPTTGTATEPINSNETRIYVRWIKIGGFVMKGALNLNNVTPGEPNWKGYDGKTALNFETITFNDGRKNDKEGTYNGLDKNEENVSLNPEIIENYSKAVWPAGKNIGVTGTYVNLFGGAPELPIFVIPTGEDIVIEICYDVETKDANLAQFLSDGVTPGSTISNTIRKTSDKIFTAKTTMEPGKGYQINIILGMTSVKFEAAVQPWDTTPGVKDVDLPANN